jgi:hypothetical protein
MSFFMLPSSKTGRNLEKSETMASQPSEEKPTQAPQNAIENDISDGQQQDQARNTEPEPSFSIYSSREKKFIVLMASMAALLSPLSANIYYPALNILAAELSVSLTLINLTITAYLVSAVGIGVFGIINVQC